jgi:FHA domain-containing protein
MVNPDGKSTMLGQWRIVLRQAEEMARAGRFDEALSLANRPDVADHRQAVQLRGRLALDLIARAARRAEADDLAGAMDDLELAERFGAAPDTLATARLRVADEVAKEVRLQLDAGEPARVVERVEALGKRKVSGPALRRLREAAEAWQSAIDEGRRGEFGRAFEQLDRADRLAAGVAQGAISAARHDIEMRQKDAHPRIEKLYEALAAGLWPEILTASEAVLALVAEHPAARQARARAWQQIAALSPSAKLPVRNGRLTWANEGPNSEDYPSPSAPAEPTLGDMPGHRRSPTHLNRPIRSGPTGRFLLWADTIGGFLVCLDDEVILGRAGTDSLADVPLLGDVSRQHATIVRSGDSYIIQASKPTFVNGQRIETAAPLRDGDVVRLGATLELGFRQPSPVSSTARLEFLSRHRLPLAVEGVILMAETCIVGPSSQAHVPAPCLRQPVVIYRQGPSLWCRASGAFEIDGRTCMSRGAVTLQSSVLGEGFSFSLEPLGPRTSHV